MKYNVYCEAVCENCGKKSSFLFGVDVCFPCLEKEIRAAKNETFLNSAAKL